MLFAMQFPICIEREANDLFWACMHHLEHLSAFVSKLKNKRGVGVGGGDINYVPRTNIHSCWSSVIKHDAWRPLLGLLSWYFVTSHSQVYWIVCKSSNRTLHLQQHVSDFQMSCSGLNFKDRLQDAYPSQCCHGAMPEWGDHRPWDKKNNSFHRVFS